MTKRLLKKIGLVALTVVAMVVTTAYSIFSFIEMGHHTHTRAINDEVATAVTKAETFPPGIERLETLAGQIRKIAPGWAPDEVKDALAQYNAALQAEMDAFKAGKDIQLYEDAQERAYQQLATAIKKNWD